MRACVFRVQKDYRQSVRLCSSGQHFYSSGLALCASVFVIHWEYFNGGQEKRETLRRLLCTFELNDPQKSFYKNSFYSGIHFQRGI